MEIIETRNISLPNMNDTLCIIMPPDSNGKRVRLCNISADIGAKIIRILGSDGKKKC